MSLGTDRPSRLHVTSRLARGLTAAGNSLWLFPCTQVEASFRARRLLENRSWGRGGGVIRLDEAVDDEKV